MPFINKNNINLSVFEQKLVDEIEFMSEGVSVELYCVPIASIHFTGKESTALNLLSKEFNRDSAGNIKPRGCALIYPIGSTGEDITRILIGVDCSSIDMTIPRDTDLLAHELSHAIHYLEYKYGGFNLHPEPFNTDFSELSDLCFHPYVYSKQIKCGLPSKIFDDNITAYPPTFAQYDNVKCSLKRLLAWRDKDAAICYIKSQKSPFELQLLEIIEIISPAYNGDLDRDKTIERLRKCYKLIDKMKSIEFENNKLLV